MEFSEIDGPAHEVGRTVVDGRRSDSASFALDRELSMKLANKVAVITGGDSGIELATAHEFKASGAKIVEIVFRII